MIQLTGKTLLIGYGNPGRLDDGLGPALAERLGAAGIPNLIVETCYQLAVEYAEQVPNFDNIIFADASINGPEPFDLTRIQPQTTIAFSTHHVSPATIMGLAETVFDSRARGFALAIRGYEFDDFGETLSAAAKQNLDAAVLLVETLFHEAPCSQP